MNSTKFTTLLMTALLATTLAACEKPETTAEEKGPAERAGEKIDKVAGKVGEELNKVAEQAGKGLAAAGEKLQNTARDAQKKEAESKGTESTGTESK